MLTLQAQDIKAVLGFPEVTKLRVNILVNFHVQKRKSIQIT